MSSGTLRADDEPIRISLVVVHPVGTILHRGALNNQLYTEVLTIAVPVGTVLHRGM